MEVVRYWLPFAVLATMMCGLVYLAVEQGMRGAANDPQIQLAEGVTSALNSGEDPASIVPPTGSIDIAENLATWAIIYEESGKVIGSSAVLDGANPQLPQGVFDYVDKNGEDRITWQPKAGVRQAIVVTPFSSTSQASADGTVSAVTTKGYVVVGRSLREIELREAQLMNQTGAVWLATLLVLLAVAALMTAKRTEAIAIIEEVVEVKPEPLPEEPKVETVIS